MNHHVSALILITFGVQTLNVLTFQRQIRWRQRGSALSVLCTAGQWTGMWFFRNLTDSGLGPDRTRDGQPVD